MSHYHIFCFCEHNVYRANTPTVLAKLYLGYFGGAHRDESFKEVLEVVKDFLAIQRDGFYEKKKADRVFLSEPAKLRKRQRKNKLQKQQVA